MSISTQFGGLGYQSQTSNVLRPGGQQSNFGSYYNNGVGRIRFQVSSFVPGNGPFSTTQKAQEFSAVPNDQFASVLAALGQSNNINLPFGGLGEFLYNPNMFAIAPDFLNAWGNFFSVPSNHNFITPFAL